MTTDSDTKLHMQSFDQMVESKGLVAAMNAHFGATGGLPDEKYPGQYHEAVGLPGLDEDVESHVRSTYQR